MLGVCACVRKTERHTDRQREILSAVPFMNNSNL